MKRLLIIIYKWLLPLLLLTACNVHEWPEEENEVALLLQLRFDTFWDEQDHFYTRGSHGTRGTLTKGETRNGVEARALGEYDMRYIIRAYSIDESGTVATIPIREFVFSQMVMTSYDYVTEEVTLPPGNYQLMAWADFVVPGTQDDMHYNSLDFTKISLTGTHTANSDYRDAFRGTLQTMLAGSINEREPQTLIIDMERPMAKFTFISNDLKEFIDKEETRVNRNNRTTKEATTKAVSTKTVDLNDYRVLFIYSGYMPNTYNMFTDRPVDITTNVQFESVLSKLNEDEASMGFDYVMVNGGDASVEVTVGLFDAEGNQISMSDPIIVPLNRSVNTIMRGSFMMMEANGGVGIDPDFDGDHNIVIP